MITADNDVLTPEILHKLAFISNKINNLKTYDDEGVLIDLNKVCFKWVIIQKEVRSCQRIRKLYFETKYFHLCVCVYGNKFEMEFDISL